MNNAALEAQLAMMTTQISFAQNFLQDASAREDAELAKLGLGILAGTLIAVSEEEDHHSIRSSVAQVSMDSSYRYALDVSSWLITRILERRVELEESEERRQRLAEWN